MNAEKRAKRMAGNLHGVLIDYHKEIPKVVISFFAKEIRAAQREAIEECLAAINGCAWRHLHKRDAVEVLEAREAILALIEKRRNDEAN